MHAKFRETQNPEFMSRQIEAVIQTNFDEFVNRSCVILIIHENSKKSLKSRKFGEFEKFGKNHQNPENSKKIAKIPKIRKNKNSKNLLKSQ